MTGEPDWVVEFAVKKAVELERAEFEMEQGRREKLEERLRKNRERSLTGAGHPVTLFKRRRKVWSNLPIFVSDR